MTTTELEPAQVQPLLPMLPSAAKEAMAAYQELTREVLTGEDWQGPPGRKGSFVKRRGWAKLATFYNVSTEICREQVDRDDQGQPVRARVIARAVHQGGRHADGDGACSIDEARFSSTKAKQNIANGSLNLEHDLTATATTRALNRAISNLIGFGEVSAEEMSQEPSGGVTEPVLPWGPVANDQQMEQAAERLAKIAPEIDAHRFVLDMGTHFGNGVPEACVKMLAALQKRITEAQTIDEVVDATATADPNQVYPPAQGGGRRYAGD